MGTRRIPEGLRRTDADWMADSVCRTMEGAPKDRVDVFFERARYGNDRAIAYYCRRCPVRTECADYAWENELEYGTFGGVTEHQRRAGQRYMVEVPAKGNRELSPVERTALEMHRAGMKWRAITRATGLHQRTIYKIVSQNRERAS